MLDFTCCFKIGSDDDLLLEKILSLHNIVKLINSVFNENQNQC